MADGADTPEGTSEGAPANIPEGFTLALALVDAVPVLLFGASMVAIAARFDSAPFAVGAVCSATAGCGKVAWKLVLAIGRRDVALLNRQFRYLMGAGFLLMVAAVAWAVAKGSLSIAAIAARIAAPPAAVFFALGLAGLVAMGVMAARLDGRVARNNWAEQLVNTCAQACVLVGILVC